MFEFKGEQVGITAMEFMHQMEDMQLMECVHQMGDVQQTECVYQMEDVQQRTLLTVGADTPGLLQFPRRYISIQTSIFYLALFAGSYPNSNSNCRDYGDYGFKWRD